MTLTEFLLARIAEDEAWRVTRIREVSLPTPRELKEAKRWEVECEAKRRIVKQYEEHRSSVMAYRSPRWKDAMNEQDKQEWRKAEARHRVAEDTVRLLALPYADHPDYREEWRP